MQLNIMNVKLYELFWHYFWSRVCFLQLPEMYEENWRINKQVFFLYLIGLMTLESIFANMYLQLRRFWYVKNLLELPSY